MLLGVVLAVLSRYLAELLNDKHLVIPLYIVSGVIVIQSLFFVNMGVLNGLKKFKAENVLMASYSIVKAIAAVLLAYLGLGVIGGVLGFLLAAFFSFTLGMLLTRSVPGTHYADIRTEKLLRHAVPIMIMFGALTAIMNIDLLAVKLFISDSRFAGYYTSAATISKFVYWYFAAFGIVLLPFISAKFAKHDVEQVAKYINDVMRYSLLLILPVIMLISVYGRDTVTLVYGSGYSEAGVILTVLIWGLLLLGLAYVLANVMIGMDRGKTMVWYSLVGISTAIAANAILVPSLGPMGGALSTVISASVVTVLPFLHVRRECNLTFASGSVVRVGVSLGMSLAIAILTLKVPVNFAVKFLVLFVLYAVLLYATGEVGQSDVNIITNLFRQKELAVER